MRTSPAVINPQERFFRTVLDHVLDAVVTTDPFGCVTFANPAAERLYGIAEVDALGRKLGDLLSSFRAAGDASLDEITAAVAIHGSWNGEIAQKTPVGPDLLVEASISLLRDDDGTILGSVSVLREISARKASERHVAHQATHDGLTGLLNRVAFLAHLADSLGSARQPTLVFIDLNAFKAINDAHGHERGDEILQAVAGRLCGATRPGDLVGRLGGDEFVILAHDLREPGAATSFLDRITAFFAVPIRCRGGNVHLIGASIGVAHAAHDDDAETVIRRADLAMYEAKHSTAASSAYRLAR